MNITIKATAAVALLAGMVQNAAAQNYGTDYGMSRNLPERVIILSGDSAKVGDRIMAVLYDTSELHFQDPKAPRFLMLDREGTTAFGIGGYVKGVMQYDFMGAIDDNGFTTYDIAVPNNPALRNRYGFDATHSTIFLRLVRQTNLGVFSAYVQTQFSGDNGAYGVKVKQAYVQLGNVIGGLTNSTFSDPSAGVPTIDYQGPSGQISKKNVLLRWRPMLTKNITAAISLESTPVSYTLSDQNEQIAQRVPDIPAYVQYGWDGGNSHIRLSGILRNLSYRNLLTQENKFVTGWGAMISGVASPIPFVTLYWQGAYGRGISSYVNDIEGCGLDLVHSSDGKMTAPKDLGIVGGIQLNLSDNLFTSVSYSYNRVYGDGTLGAEAYRHTQYWVANAFYTLGHGFQVGLEYLHGSRTDRNLISGSANRVEAMIQYSF